MKLNLSKSSSKIIFSYLCGVIALSGIVPQIINPKLVNAQSQLYSVPTIDWSDRLSSFEQEDLNTEQVYSFNCTEAPERQVYTPVWGTDLYTINSGLCQAAVHQGIITNSGGLINIKLLTANSDYQGSDRFGISSLDYNRPSDGFQFIGNPIASETNLPEDNQQQQKGDRRPSQIERTVGNGVRRGIERTISDSIRDIFR